MVIDHNKNKQVYFIQSVDGGPIKIGHAKELNERFQFIQSMSPCKLKILASFAGCSYHEYLLHQKFKKHRLHGEWFEPNETLYDLIEEVKNGSFLVDQFYLEMTKPFKSLEITDWQWQIVTGSILGGAKFSKNSQNYYLKIRESKNINWLNYKAQELKNISAKTAISEIGNSHIWRSKSNPVWFEFKKNHFHSGKQMAKMEILDKLKDIALAVWFCDKGFWYTNSKIAIRTTNFSNIGCEVILRYFREIDMDCDYFKYKTNSKIVFSVNGTKKFLQTIGNCLPSYMYYKLQP